MSMGYTHSQEVREKMRRVALTRDNTKRIESLPRREKHWNWNDKPSINAMHKRLHRWKGKASDFLCDVCGVQAQDWSNETKEYYDLEKYKPLCRSCHVKLDKNWIKN